MTQLLLMVSLFGRFNQATIQHQRNIFNSEQHRNGFSLTEFEHRPLKRLESYWFMSLLVYFDTISID